MLTGSTRQNAVPRTAQALTGRSHSFVILPLSQGEIRGTHENLLSSLHEDPVATVAALPTASTSRAEYAAVIAAGGFPLALPRTGSSRDRWFDDYARTSIARGAGDQHATVHPSVGAGVDGGGRTWRRTGANAGRQRRAIDSAGHCTNGFQLANRPRGLYCHAQTCSA